MTGFYLMHRGWMDNDVFPNTAYSEREAWEWMIGAAFWEARTINVLGRPTEIKRGQFSHSVRFMAEKFQWSKSAVDRFLDKLKKRDMICTENGTAQLIVTIRNYDIYQDMSFHNGTAAGQFSGTAAGQQRDKEENLKNLKQEKEAVDDRAARAEIERLCGWDQNPNWLGNFSRMSAWIAKGWSLDLDILPTIRRVMSKRQTGQRPPQTLNYFENAIADAYEARMRPVPSGDSQRAQSQQPQPRKANDWTHTLEAGRKAHERRMKETDEPPEY